MGSALWALCESRTVVCVSRTGGQMLGKREGCERSADDLSASSTDFRREIANAQTAQEKFLPRMDTDKHGSAGTIF